MTDYLNWKILKSIIDYKGDDEDKQNEAQLAQQQYSEVADWCTNNQQYYIVETELYYEVQPIPNTSEDILKEQVRQVRDNYLLETDYTQLPDAPFNEEEKIQYANYRQYLRDYTLLDNWWLSNPKTFEEWLNNNN